MGNILSANVSISTFLFKNFIFLAKTFPKVLFLKVQKLFYKTGFGSTSLTLTEDLDVLSVEHNLVVGPIFTKNYE